MDQDAEKHLQESVLTIARQDFNALRKEWTVDEALQAIRRQVVGEEIIYFYVIDEAGRLRGTPRLSAPGLLDADDKDTARIASELAEAMADLPAPIRRDDVALADAAKAALRRSLGRRLQKRPLVDVHLLRV